MNPIGRLAPADLSAFLTAHPNTILLDVREPWEHELAAIAGSTLIPLGTVALRAEDELPDHDATIVVYCHHGVRSMQACAILASLGYSSLFNLTGGIDRYSADVDRSIPAY
jgi:rhodanese-related sulfurtransferase